ncbi:MAG: hypothetical protein MI749_00250 [Desulfovibrionales bacterium]|nr:hypothetical protein [Desulfovibrionales bacterium]
MASLGVSANLSSLVSAITAYRTNKRSMAFIFLKGNATTVTHAVADRIPVAAIEQTDKNGGGTFQAAHERFPNVPPHGTWLPVMTVSGC